ncbi:T-cell differentiation antigen CD6 isoform X17 [Macaca mulatta]|uniref:T-cell differentiation antigen CD6 isoform X5 n=1 Tax=Macaca mulatta TaxID=9544 RepID=UPI0010A2264E|nr:T-cell differentiation antigen CD6 isoform X5 [Macaca mulatta]
MWLFFGIAGLLTAALSGHLSPAPSDQLNASSAESEVWQPGERLPVRLTNGSSSCSGTVEVRLRASWEPACWALWDSRAAEAVCRALDCGGAEAATLLPRPTPELPPPPAAGNTSAAANATLAGAPALLCSGTEWQLCEVVEHACRSDGRRARVICAENRALRLVDGGGACAGRVEMLEHGEWGSVCDDTWDLEDAHVVCRQLGCGWAVQAVPGLHFTPGRGPIHRDQVNCSGAEAYLWDCPGLPGQHYCGHKEDAGVVCSASRSLHNLSTSEVPASVQTVTTESSVTVKLENKESRELMLFISSIVLGILLLGSLIFIAFILLRIKGKYALPVMVNHQHLPTTNPAGSNSYQPVPITIPKEVFMLPIEVQAPPPEDSDSGSDSDYEHYDFSAQPPVALTTFYNSQRHRVTDEEVQQSRFQMPPLEEGLEELHASHIPAANPGHCITDPPSLGPQYHPRSNSESSTSSGEDYCNSPRSKPPPWNPQVFSSERSSFPEQPPNLELAGTQPAFSAGPSADDSSSTSSGEWYQNFQPPPQPPSEEQFGCPGSPSPQPDSTDNDDYDDIGAA